MVLLSLVQYERMTGLHGLVVAATSTNGRTPSRVCLHLCLCLYIAESAGLHLLLLLLMSSRQGSQVVNWTRQSEWREGPIQHSSVGDNGWAGTSYTGIATGTATATTAAADTDTYIGTGTGTGTRTSRCTVAGALLHGPEVTDEGE